MPGVGLLEHVVFLFLVLKEPAWCSLYWLYQFTCPAIVRIQFFPYPLQLLLFIDVLMIAVVTDER